MEDAPFFPATQRPLPMSVELLHAVIAVMFCAIWLLVSLIALGHGDTRSSSRSNTAAGSKPPVHM